MTSDLKSTVAEVNQLTKSIAAANQRIASLRGSGQPANDVLDERDRLISQLSERIQITRIEADDGTVGLFIAGGQRLVLGGSATDLLVVASDVDPSRSALAMREGTATRRIDDAGLGGGTMAGLLRFQNKDLVQARNLVGQLAASVAGAVNAQQMRGLSLQQPLGSVPSQPMFALGPQQALHKAATLRDPNTNLPIGDGDAHHHRPRGAGGQRLRTARKRQPPRQLGPDAPVRRPGAPGEQRRRGRWHADRHHQYPARRPLSAAAGGARRQRHARAAEQPAGHRGRVAADGHGRVHQHRHRRHGRSGDHRVALPFPGSSEQLQFYRLTPPVNGMDYEYVSSITGTATPWRTGLPVVGANGYTLQISGVPADGDVINIDPTPAASLASNNGNARALLALRDGLIVGGRTVTDSWSQSLADMGVRVQSAESSASISAAVAQQTEQVRSGQDGVNLDEEAARLIQFQQSYQAAAKVLQVAQSLFDTLLQATS